jgi:SAM-dependent methyltransferase
LRSRGFFRTLIRTLYLRDIKKYCIGETIDFGCGTGSLLAILPVGSIGYEINDIAVKYCRSRGLDVEYYVPEFDNYQLDAVPENKYTSFTMNHVLEHLENSHLVLNKLFKTCRRLGIQRIVLTVPGSKCFRQDETHRTFVNRQYLEDRGMLENQYYKLILSKYFPFNAKGIDRYFTHNELRMVFDNR